MASQANALEKAIIVSGHPIDGSQHGHIIATLQCSVETEDAGNEGITESPNKPTMKVTIAAQEDVTDGKAVASTATTTTTPPQLSTDDNEPSDSSMITSFAMPPRKSADKPPSTPYKAAGRHRNPSPAPSTPCQLSKASSQSRNSFTVQISTICPGPQGGGSVTAPKRPRSPSPSSAGPGILNTLDIDFLSQQQEFVFRKVFDSLKEVWDSIIKDCKRYFAAPETRPDIPDIDEARDLIVDPEATLQEVADDTAHAVYKSLISCYKHCPSRVFSDMQIRFLSSSAKIKSEVLEHVTVVNTITPFLLPLDPNTPWPPVHGAYRFHNPSPRPSTPTRNNQAYSQAIEELQPRIKRLNLGDRNNDDDDDDDDAGSMNVEFHTPTPSPAPRTPSGDRDGAETPPTKRHKPSARSPALPQTPRRSQRDGDGYPTTPVAHHHTPRRSTGPRHPSQHRTPATQPYPRGRGRSHTPWSAPYSPPARRSRPRFPVVGQMGRYLVREPVGQTSFGAAAADNYNGYDGEDVFRY
ncbi:hypothetical protein Daesc_001691 [Daldinia eschscholtzii]|uniref:Uncharacterized protein n=1 Tax=Daldinia eschscholtzii TaxID=292717 RepID=A0AAX6MV86_9PEZI